MLCTEVSCVKFGQYLLLVLLDVVGLLATGHCGNFGQFVLCQESLHSNLLQSACASMYVYLLTEKVSKKTFVWLFHGQYIT